MPARVEWITFEQLCERASWTSASTLERLIRSKRISVRQTRRGAPRRFNWNLVERELANLDKPSAARVAEEIHEEDARDRRLARLEAKFDILAEKLGVDFGESLWGLASSLPEPVFSGKHPGHAGERIAG